MTTRALRQDEIALLESALVARGQFRNRLFLTLATATGFRVSELLSLRWRDLLTATGEVTSQLTIERRALKGGCGIHRKSIRSRRVPLGNNRARNAIADLLASLGTPPPGDSFVFKSRIGDNNPVTRGQVHRWLKRLARELGLDATRVGCHSARRAFAAAVYKAGGLLVAQRLLGHSSPLTTALYLIKKFADATNKKAGEFYTPRSIVRLMVNILDPKEGESIYDPACGTGGMLLEAVYHVKASHGDDRTLWGKLFAQEKNLTTSAIARMNLFLHGASDFQVVRGDTLRQPAFFLGDNLATFDCVIANPPFSLEKWGDEVWASDPYGRNFAGMPPSKSGDYAWVQHMIKSLAPKSGRMAVVLPHGALFRMGKEGEIRKKILGMDLLEAVIGLGPNLFYGSGLAACILIFRQRKAKDWKNKVLILDASRELKTGRAQNEMLPEHAQRILNWYNGYKDVAGIARVVTLEEIAANDHNLNIPRYVEPKVEEETVTVDEAMQMLRQSADLAFAAETKLARLLRSEELLIEWH